MKNNTTNLKENFINQVAKEYEDYYKKTLKLTPKEIFDESLRCTFYLEVFKYLFNADLTDDEIIYYREEQIINRLWETFLLSNLSKSHDYFRQLLILIRKNNMQKQYERLLSKIKSTN